MYLEILNVLKSQILDEICRISSPWCLQQYFKLGLKYFKSSLESWVRFGEIYWILNLDCMWWTTPQVVIGDNNSYHAILSKGIESVVLLLLSKWFKKCFHWSQMSFQFWFECIKEHVQIGIIIVFHKDSNQCKQECWIKLFK